MRIANNAKISHQDTGSNIEPKGASAFVRNTASVLTIPRLSQSIQTKFNSGLNASALASLALNLLRKGYIEEKATGELNQLVKEGVQKWLLGCAGQLKYFDFKVELTPDISYLTEYMDDYIEDMEAKFKELAGESPMFLTIESGHLPIITVGKKLQEIEDKTAGLGKTAYYWLACVGASNLEVFTPWMGTAKAENTWWYGNDNQEDFVEEVSQYYEDADDLENALEVSPDAWDAAFPKWVTTIDQALSEEELKVIALAEPCSLESEVAGILLDMIKNKDASLPDVRMTPLESVYHGMYVYWEENDMSSRLSDDWLQQINEMGGDGYTDVLSLTPIPSKPFDFRKWMAEMEAGFTQLKNIERLIDLIGTRTN